MASKLVEFHLRFNPWWVEYFTEEAMEYMADGIVASFFADMLRNDKIRLEHDISFCSVWIPADKKYTLDELKELWKGADIDDELREEVLDNIYNCD